VSCTKTAEPIEVPFGVWTRVGPRKRVLNGDAHWSHLANTIEASMYGGDAAFLSNYFDRLFLLMRMLCLQIMGVILACCLANAVRAGYNNV